MFTLNKTHTSKIIERAVIEITRSCNNNCVYCYQETRGKHSNQQQKRIRESIVSLREKGVKYIEFSGGEPTLSEDLCGLISLAAGQGYENISLLTNGRRLAYKAYLAKIINSGLKTIIISLPAYDGLLYEKITRTKKRDLTQVKKALENLRQYKGLEKGAVILVNRLNYKSLDAVIDLFSREGFSFVTLSYMLPYSDEATMKLKSGITRFIPDYGEAAPYLKSAIKKFKGKIRVLLDGVPFCLLPGYEGYILNEVFSKNCYVFGGGKKMINRLEMINLASIRLTRCAGCQYKNRCAGFLNAPQERLPGVAAGGRIGQQKAALDIQSGPCEYRCIFCTRQREGRAFYELDSHADKAQIDKDKLNLFFKYSLNISRRLDIWGRERLDVFNKIHQVLRNARQAGFKEIILWCSGLRFNSISNIAALIKSGVTGFEMPIYGHNQDVHDSITRIPGSFKRLLKGIEIAERFEGLKLGIHTVMLKQNVNSIPKLLELIHSRFKQIQLSLWFYYPDMIVNSAQSNLYRKCCPSFTEVIDAFKEYKDAPMQCPVLTAFLPLCILMQLKTYITRIEPIKIGPVRLLVCDKDSSSFSYLDGKHEFNTVFAEKCDKCSVKKDCYGVFREYLDLYGTSELQPL